METPLLLLLLLSFLLPADASNSSTYASGAKNLCPEAAPMCFCSVNMEHKLSAMCSQDVTRTPTGLPPETLILTIYCNSKTDSIGRPLHDGRQMDNIRADAFHSLRRLEELTISRCPLSELPPFLLANLTRLSFLSLESLLLRSIRGSLLSGSNNLHKLHLVNLPDLHAVDPVLLAAQTRLAVVVLQRTLLDGDTVEAMLRPLHKSLKDLLWSFNRVPVTLPAHMFLRFRLRQLNLRYNQLTNLEFLVGTRCRYLSLHGNVRVLGLGSTPPFDFSRCRGLRNLIELNLAGTNLRQLHDNTFSKMKNLRKLHLRENQLVEVPVGIYTNFALISKLTEIDLSNNKIQVFPDGMAKLFSRPETVAVLDGNPLHCNCETGWLLAFPKQLHGLRCATAPLNRAGLRGKLLSSLSTDQLVCTRPSQPVITATNMVQMRGNEWDGRLSTYLATPAQHDLRQIIEYRDGQKYITVSRGQTLSLRCVSSGEPAPELFWLFSWGAVARREADTDRTINSNEISAKIPQERLGAAEFSNITCRASNRAGTRNDIVFLKNLSPREPSRPPVTPQPSIKDRPRTAAPLPLRPCVPLLLLPLLLLARIS